MRLIPFIAQVNNFKKILQSSILYTDIKFLLLKNLFAVYSHIFNSYLRITFLVEEGTFNYLKVATSFS